MTDAAPRSTAEAPPPIWKRHDLLVLAVAAALLLAGALAYRVLIRPELIAFEHRGLRFERPTGYFPPQDIEVPPSSLAGLAAIAPSTPAPAAPSTRFHKLYKTPEGPLVALEVLVDRRPDYQGVAMVLQQARRLRYGEYLWTARADEREVNGHAWLRTEFQYAVKATDDDAPQVATAVEYATVNDDLLYVVTVHGTEEEARRLESLVQTSLELSRTGG